MSLVRNFVTVKTVDDAKVEAPLSFHDMMTLLPWLLTFIYLFIHLFIY